MGLNVKTIETLAQRVSKFTEFEGKGSVLFTKTKAFNAINPAELKIKTNSMDTFIKKMTYEDFNADIVEKLQCHDSSKNNGLLKKIQRWLSPKTNKNTILKAKLNENELDAVYNYVTQDGVAGGSYAYNPKNGIIPFYENLSNAINKSTISKDIVVYRGVRQDEILNNGYKYSNCKLKIEQLVNEKYYTSKGYTSTSLDAAQANSYCMGNDVMFRIHVPKGAKGLEIDEHTNLIKDYAQRTNQVNDYITKTLGTENEILLPMNTKMKILGIEKLPVPQELNGTKNKTFYIFDMKLI